MAKQLLKRRTYARGGREWSDDRLVAARNAFEAEQSRIQREVMEAMEEGMEDRVASLEYLVESDVPEVNLPRRIYEAASRIDWHNKKLSFKKLRQYATESYRELGEANTTQAWGQLLRAGIQNIANEWYKKRPVSWPNYVQETSSDKRQEFFAPLYGSGLPTITGQGEPYSENQLAGQDIEIINIKVMGGESFTRELFDDDQTGQIRQRASKLGEGMKQYEEIYVAARLTGVAQTIAGRTIGASRYTTKNPLGTTVSAVYSTALFSATTGNKPAAFTVLTVPAIKAARFALLNAVDPLGIKLLNDPRTLVISPTDTDNAAIIAHSEYYPATPGLSGQNASNASSGTGGALMAKNPWFNMINPVMNVYLPSWSWFLGTAQQGMVFQRRDPMEIIQEVPNSGASFTNDVIRFKSRSRFEVEWLESRFWYEGNDGSVVGNF